MWLSLVILWVDCSQLCSFLFCVMWEGWHLTESPKVAYLHCWLSAWACWELDGDCWFLCLCSLNVTCPWSLNFSQYGHWILKGSAPGGMGLYKGLVHWGPFLETRKHQLDLAYLYPICIYPRIMVCGTVHKIPKLRLPTLYSLIHPKLWGSKQDILLF